MKTFCFFSGIGYRKTTTSRSFCQEASFLAIHGDAP
jgi:hypothetical protein